ncbi:recombinase family protein [Clostridium cadaveris]|uniref:recombinase family protein n=1 Tax=Clostridium cadaveris TaxID=1529 RepID=UPI001E616DBC|nr:recombinase family protein [Clostridium cadaveris]UFH66466.1 recombinase family protein [Clostridium cadaveris]
MERELIKVCAYCRVSTDKKEQEESFENQQIYFNRELNKEKGFELTNIYADKGLTGMEFRHRTEFNKMLQDAGLDKVENRANSGEIRNKYISTDYVINPKRKPKFKYIYVKNTSRFARNTDVSKIVKALRANGVYIFFLDLNKSTESPEEMMLLEFMFSMDARESIDKSKKVAFGAKESAKAGKIRVGKELYGYTFNKEENTLRIIKEEAEIVKLIYNLRLQGEGSRRICKYLRENNIKTRAGVDFKENVVMRILQNPYYTGRVARNRWETTHDNGRSRKLKPVEEWIVQESDRVDQIIDIETFDKVQKIIKENTSDNIKKGKYLSRTELARKIYCCSCGKYYNKNVEYRKLLNGERKKIDYYTCATKKLRGKGSCQNPNIRKEKLDNIIEFFCKYGQLKEITDNFKESVIEILENKKNILKEKVNTLSKNIDVEEKNKQIDILNNKLSRLLDIYLDEGLTKDIFNKKKEQIEEDINRLKKEIDNINIPKKNLEAILDFYTRTEYIIQNIGGEIPNEISRKDFIEKYLVRFEISKDGKVTTITKAHLIQMIGMELAGESGEYSNVRNTILEMFNNDENNPLVKAIKINDAIKNLNIF